MSTKQAKPVSKRRRAEVSEETIESLLRKLIRQMGPTSAVPKKTRPHGQVENSAGWKAKFQAGDDEIDLVPFPIWAIWFVKDKEQDRLVPHVEPMVPADDEGNFDWGSELEGYIGFEEPPESPGLDDLDDLDDEGDGDGDDDDDPESIDGDDDDDNPIDQMDGGDQDLDGLDVIDTAGEEVKDE